MRGGAHTGREGDVIAVRCRGSLGSCLSRGQDLEALRRLPCGSSVIRFLQTLRDGNNGESKPPAAAERPLSRLALAIGHERPSAGAASAQRALALTEPGRDVHLDLATRHALIWFLNDGGMGWPALACSTIRAGSTGRWPTVSTVRLNQDERTTSRRWRRRGCRGAGRAAAARAGSAGGAAARAAGGTAGPERCTTPA